MQLAVVQYQDAINFIVHHIAGSSSQRIEPVLIVSAQPPKIVVDIGKIVTESRNI